MEEIIVTINPKFAVGFSSTSVDPLTDKATRKVFSLRHLLNPVIYIRQLIK